MNRAQAMAEEHMRDDLFHCYLLDQPGYLAPARLIDDSYKGEKDVIVNPNAWFSWQNGHPDAPPDCESLPEGFYLHSEFIWITDPASGVQTPFWVDPADQYKLAHLTPGQSPPATLSHKLFPLLRAAGILIAPDATALRQQEWNELCSQSSETFAEHSCVPTGQLIHPYLVGELRRYYRRLLRTGGMTLGDEGSSQRYVIHNDCAARFFHEQLAPVVSSIAGAPVKPSYVYVAAYQPGADLVSHIDREQCEYTITILIDHVPEPDYQSSWPLCLETPGGTVAFWLGVGEGLLYRGRELPHFRSRIHDGMTSTTLSFHYVDEAYTGSLD